MCGITGFVDFKKRSSEQQLAEMTGCLAHRGPDASGLRFTETTDATIGFGHRRLAIIDLSERGAQPMRVEELLIVFNGEIYNYREIRKELEAVGIAFHSDSDTEVILQSYRQWGPACLEKFTGMFAFVIYDTQNHELFLARDRAGVKPLFCYFHEGLFLFASELKAFHKHPGFQKEMDHSAVQAYFQFGYVPAPYSIFANVFKLRPGHWMKISTDRPGTIVQESYWSVYDAYNKEKLDLSVDEALRETEKVLSRACEYRMVADVPVGVFLSGGYDSSAVTALLQKERTERLKTYTISVPDIGLDEAPFAKNIARHLGTDHHEYACNEAEAIEFAGRLADFYDEPFADSSAIPTMLVSKMARKDVTVALSADAGDEVFGGYNRYEMILRYGRTMQRIPGFARKSLSGLMNAVPASRIPHFNKGYNFAQRYEKIKGILRHPEPENILLGLSQLFTDKQLADLLVRKAPHLQTNFTEKNLLHPSPLSQLMAMDYVTYLPDDILQKVDRASMHTGLESREPLVDHHLIEWVAQLPDDLKYRNGEKKWLLKEIVHQYIPKELMDRPKTGFAIPIERWMQTALREQVEHFLSEAYIRDQGLFNAKEINRLKQAFFSGKMEYGLRIWYLLAFQLWYERWIN